MSFNLLKHRSLQLSQEVNARLKAPPRQAIHRKMETLTDGHGPPNANINLKELSALYRTTHYGPLSFPGTPFLANPLPPNGVKGASSILSFTFDSSTLFQGPSATPSRPPGPSFDGFQVQETVFTRFSRVVDYRFNCLLNTKQKVLVQKAQCICDTKKRVVGALPYI